MKNSMIIIALVLFAIIMVGCQNTNNSSTEPEHIEAKEVNNKDKVKDKSVALELVLDNIIINLEKKLTYNDLKDIPNENLDIIRNAYFAKYGYIFEKSEYNKIFRAQLWYVPDDSISDINTLLNEVDWYNVDLVLKMERNFNALSNNLTEIEESMIGFWHISPHVGAGYGERYIFNEDRTYSFHASQYYGEDRLRGIKGKWFILNNELFLLPIEEEYYEGGELVEASPSMLSEYELSGGEIIVQKIKEPIVEELKLDSNMNKDENEPNSIIIGEDIFYYLGEAQY